MPGWSIVLSANNGADGMIAAMIPYKDSNMTLSSGRFLIYDAQNFAANPDGSMRLQVLWDIENWAPNTPSHIRNLIDRSYGTDGSIVPPMTGGWMSTGWRFKQNRVGPKATR
jgi:hypothetical protein